MSFTEKLEVENFATPQGNVIESRNSRMLKPENRQTYFTWRVGSLEVAPSFWIKLSRSRT